MLTLMVMEAALDLVRLRRVLWPALRDLLPSRTTVAAPAG